MSWVYIVWIISIVVLTSFSTWVGYNWGFKKGCKYRTPLTTMPKIEGE